MYRLTVTHIQHYTDHLFRFQTTRPQNFRFQSGEFVMIGLEQEQSKPIMRAYSIASPKWDDSLEFYSIKVADGALTSKLRAIRCGDEVLMGKKSVGTLVYDALLPGKTLYLLSTGTGIAPFASIIRDPETYEKFERVVLVHCCRTSAELSYGFELMEQIRTHEYLAEIAQGKLFHYTSVTREPYESQERIPALISSGRIFTDLSLPAMDKAVDRIMICGSAAMLQDCKSLCLELGFSEGSHSSPGEFVIEKAFVD